MQKFLNDLQLKIDPGINQNTWIDTFELLSNNNQIPSSKNNEDTPSRTNITARISGRYLVQPSTQLNSLPEENRKLTLIEESGLDTRKSYPCDCRHSASGSRQKKDILDRG